MILDAITSSPLNVFFTIFLGLGLAYFYYKKPSSSSSSSTSASSRTLSPTAAAYSTQRLNSGLNRNHLAGSGGVISDELQRTIAQIERQERDMIRQEQDEAYQQSLKADREKRIRKEEEDRIREAEEKKEKERVEKLEQLHISLLKLKSEITDKLPIEPSLSQDNIVKLVFKLPDGSRVQRNFLITDKVKYLYWYVFSLEKAPLQFKMTTNFPKRDLPGRPPLPEDFDKSENGTSNKSTSSINNSPDIINPETSESNSESTLQEACLTETQIIFVYDLEA